LFFKNIEIARQLRYSRGSIPLFRGVSRRDRVFSLINPELNQNIMFLIEEIILTCLRAYTHRQILFNSIKIIEIPILLNNYKYIVV
jgi:hypothetical protein